ncbi:uncharacterized protein LACBIDRAFT_318092 [Laccaria bicolor S238N-H82]|uniref:Predicted protein n=1 Tax=Laccaria bicolor (strain S238N-H82 / ATCC MYA-4686) TaxID=486041 RepID=B0D5Y9_LACBS|nr:uncharacterized protein LACBIDRAFT_318092 [Laccaria bicolor S238N-H82]EDR09851.1 predicted protein [Laccaria bicolor S238N-H82]|eukprot:XP_001879236.1 predicted protein [Laccaria bicolor S238N-H82]
MSTFARTCFNASAYSALRPNYPSKLFKCIFSYHIRSGSARWERAVDMGCGTGEKGFLSRFCSTSALTLARETIHAGQATPHLSPFYQVIGIDPSEGMLQRACTYVTSLDIAPSGKEERFKFLKGSAEDLHLTVEDGSVDLLIAVKVWPETQRVLRKGGTAAYWVYAEFRLPAYPSLTPLITSYHQGSDSRSSVGMYFQRPGRTILERMLVDIPDPAAVLGGKSELGDVQRMYFFGTDSPPPITLPPGHNPQLSLMRKEMSWRDLLGYFRTASALHTYHEKHPEDLDSEEDVRFLADDIEAASLEGEGGS